MAPHLSRRHFLKTASLAAASVPLSKVAAQAAPGVVKSSSEAPGTFKDTETVVGGICEMCFWRCQLVGKVRDGRLIRLEGNPKSIDNGRALCARGNAGVKLLYDPDRLKYPLKNVGKRGAPKWQRISWEEALDTCGSKLKAIVDKYGAKGIAMFPHGSSAKYPMDFLERTVGTPNISEPSFFQCRGVRDMAYITTLEIAPDENVDMANAKVIFLLGCHFGENIHLSHVKNYLKGLERGAKLVVVDPRFSASAAKADIWMPIRPGTDTALLLAIMNYLIQNEKYAVDFVDEYGEGFEEMAEGIAEWTLERAAKECDVPAAQIKEVADLLADNMPNVAIHPGRHVTWYGSDFQRGRAQACLTGLLGAIGVKGGLVIPKGPKGIARVDWPHTEQEEDSNLKEMAEVHYFAPPGTPTELIRDTAISGDPYPIKGCVIWGQNPIQAIPDQPKTIKMLEQMDFVLCVDVMPTDITMYADILLPDCSYMEKSDYLKTGTQWDLSAEQQQYIAPRMPLVAPGFERRDPVWITNEIARRMGYGDKIPVQSQEELMDKRLAGVNLSMAQIRAEGGIHIQPGEDPYGVDDDLIVHFSSEELADEDYPAIPTYTPTPQPPEGYLRLIYGRTPLHSFNRTANNAWLVAEAPTNPLWVNDKLAARLGLKHGETIRLVNQDGVESTGTTTVKVTPGIREDVVYLYHGYGTRNPEMTQAVNLGIDDCQLITKSPIDPETGGQGMRANFVKIVKAG
ncbi:MAG: molybdopterin-dependent oxidoreductase [Desulfobulbus sp.]|jgi:thiosulfate reductase/polysulfide reductase chain A